MTRIKLFLCIGSYDKWFYIKSWQKFANLLVLCKAPSKKDFLKHVGSTVVFAIEVFGGSCPSLLQLAWKEGTDGFAFLWSTKTYLFKYTENFTTKNWKISDKSSAQNIDCGYSLETPCRGGSNEYPQSMFLSRNKKNNVYPCKPQFYYIKVGFKWVEIIQVCFRDGFVS